MSLAIHHEKLSGRAYVICVPCSAIYSHKRVKRTPTYAPSIDFGHTYRCSRCGATATKAALIGTIQTAPLPPI